MRVSLSVLHRRLPPGRGRFRRILAKSERGSGSRHLRRCLSNTQGAVWVQSLRRRGSSHGRRPRSNVAQRWEAHWLSVGVEGAVGVWQADAGAPGRQLLPGIDVVVVVGVLAGRLVVLASPGERPTGSTAAVFVVITVLLVVLVVRLLFVVVVVPVAQPKLVVNCRNRCKVHKVREPVRGDDVCLLGNKPVTRPDLEAEPSQLQVLPPQHRGVKHPTVLQLHVLELQHAHPARATRSRTTNNANAAAKKMWLSLESDMANTARGLPGDASVELRPANNCQATRSSQVLPRTTRSNLTGIASPTGPFARGSWSEPRCPCAAPWPRSHSP